MSPIWISHRGYCEKGATENTKAAFYQSLELGFNHMETDLRLTQDGVIVLHHDSSLRRTFHSELRIEETSYDQLAGLRSKDGEELLSLERLFAEFASCYWTFDVKMPDVATLLALKDWANSVERRSWMEKNVRFLFWNSVAESQGSSIFPLVMQLARENACYRAGLAVMLNLGFLSGIQRDKTYSLPPSFRGISLFEDKFVKAYHNKGARLLAYLPPDKNLAKKAEEAGFDEILTNGPKYS